MEPSAILALETCAIGAAVMPGLLYPRGDVAVRRYETIVILDPDLPDETRQPLVDRVLALIEQFQGTLLKLDPWGARQLAYPIQKKKRGYYVRFDYCGEGPLVDEIERYFKITDSFLKYMTIVLDKDADPERIRQELAEAEAKAKAPAPASDGDDDRLDEGMDDEDDDGEDDGYDEDENDDEMSLEDKEE